jgi:ribosomal protein S27AE
MLIKLDRKCPTCGSSLEFAERKDGVYVLCRRCHLAVYMPVETVSEYATDFPTLVDLMAEELADMAKKVKKRRN